MRSTIVWLLAAVGVVAGGTVAIGVWQKPAPAATYRVTSGSMESTLAIGQVVTAAPVGSLHVGEVVLFHPPTGALGDQPVCGAVQGPGAVCSRPTAVDEQADAFIKRIVAGPGDTISIRAGHVIRNGVAALEPFALACSAGDPCDFPTPVTLAPGYWFLMGDNRGRSDDSRFWGPVPAGWIFGAVRAQ